MSYNRGFNTILSGGNLAVTTLDVAQTSALHGAVTAGPGQFTRLATGIVPLSQVGIESAGNVTAASGAAYGAIVANTLVASANNDVLQAVLITGVFVDGVFTGVAHYALNSGLLAPSQFAGPIQPATDNTVDFGSGGAPLLRWKDGFFGGTLRFGTYVATPGAITGYITITDAAGNTRKLAVTT